MPTEPCFDMLENQMVQGHDVDAAKIAGCLEQQGFVPLWD